ncbi:MAG: class I SAM-dependent methyltransferase [Haloferacaceae archaeon]
MYGPGDVGFFDRIPPLYDLFMWPADPGPFRRAFDGADRPIRRLIDLGGGTGRAAAALDGPDDPDECVVVDLSRGMLQRASRGGLPAVLGDARRLPVAADAVDAVTIVDALHHMPDRETVLRECARILAPGGVLVVRDFDPGTVRGSGLALAERAVGFGSRFVRPDALVDAVAEVGLDAHVLDRGFAFTVAGYDPRG